MKGEDHKTCPYCGEEIKAKAVKCKHCHSFLDESQGNENAAFQARPTSAKQTPASKKPIWKKWWSWTAAALVILILIIASGGGEEAEGESPSSDQATADEQTIDIQEEPAEDPEMEITFMSIGETTTFGEWEYKVIDVELHDVIDDERPRGQYIVFMIEATNNANMDRQVGRLFSAMDQEGRIFSFDSRASLSHHQAYRTDAWHLEDIGPSFSAVMPIAFDIPLDVEMILLVPREIKDADFQNTSIFRYWIDN